MYQLNDTILYGGHGVCKIADITKKALGGTMTDYYVLKPVYHESSTIYVPMKNKTLTEKMRRVLSADEVYRLISAMPFEDSIWVEDENERKERYREILAHGDRLELMRMIKTLYMRQGQQQEKGRRLHISDERFFKEAEKLLYDEFALVLNLKPEQVLPFILAQIEVDEKSGAEPPKQSSHCAEDNHPS